MGGLGPLAHFPRFASIDDLITLGFTLHDGDAAFRVHMPVPSRWTATLLSRCPPLPRPGHGGPRQDTQEVGAGGGGEDHDEADPEEHQEARPLRHQGVRLSKSPRKSGELSKGLPLCGTSGPAGAAKGRTYISGVLHFSRMTCSEIQSV